MAEIIKINRNDIENTRSVINSFRGVEFKQQNIVDISTISGWINCINSVPESDNIRGAFSEAEDLHSENIGLLGLIWEEFDESIAKNF